MTPEAIRLLGAVADLVDGSDTVDAFPVLLMLAIRVARIGEMERDAWVRIAGYYWDLEDVDDVGPMVSGGDA